MSGDTVVIFQWPDIMAAPRAAEYCDVSQAAVSKARRQGALLAAGRRGGVGAYTYLKTELDRWMRGVRDGDDA